MRMRAVQYLYNENDGSRIVRLDLGNNVLQVISRASLRLRGRGYSKVKMNTDTYLGMPAVETNVMIRYASRARKLKGNFNIDFGNPELLFLMHQHKDVQQFFAENSDIQLRQARNPQGDVVAQFVIADECRICVTAVHAHDAIIGSCPRRRRRNWTHFIITGIWPIAPSPESAKRRRQYFDSHVRMLIM